jgi:hypothetical protein
VQQSKISNRAKTDQTHDNFTMSFAASQPPWKSGPRPSDDPLDDPLEAFENFSLETINSEFAGIGSPFLDSSMSDYSSVPGEFFSGNGIQNPGIGSDIVTPSPTYDFASTYLMGHLDSPMQVSEMGVAPGEIMQQHQQDPTSPTTPLFSSTFTNDGYTVSPRFAPETNMSQGPSLPHQGAPVSASQANDIHASEPSLRCQVQGCEKSYRNIRGLRLAASILMVVSFLISTSIL